MLLDVQNVSKRFSQGAKVTDALAGVSFSVREGEFVSLIGPSGCGKSTLLNLAAGLERPDGGAVLFAGQSVAGPNTRVGYMTQDDALLPWRSVRGNVALPLEIQSVPRRERIKRADEILERVGLKGFEGHLPMQLSGGMRKRVSLARTLVYGARALLLDEPFGALDALTRTVMQQVLLDVVAALGLTVLLVTHDLHEAIAMSDRIVVFSRRPARVLDAVEVPGGHSAQPGLGRRGAGDDALRARLWELLSVEQGSA